MPNAFNPAAFGSGFDGGADNSSGAAFYSAAFGSGFHGGADTGVDPASALPGALYRGRYNSAARIEKKLKLITPATQLPVSLADVKVHLRVDTTDEDSLITIYTMTAAELAEQATGRALMTQTWELTLDAFPEAFELTRVPAASITSLRYWDTAGVQQTLGTGVYTLDNTDEYGYAYVVPVVGQCWPDTREQINAVALRYVAGYATVADVPESIKSWIKLQVGAMHRNRESESAVQTYALGFADRLLDRYKVWSL